ncbi:hypothetical protein BC829DRAFT_298714 [Chytridium lagenaria]|nr:hypothetical protein BC829DRAFT_298714 [Chytridium lagenaria]
MNHVGMNVTNLRNTLSNLKALIDVVGEDAENQSEDDVYTDGGSLSSHTIRQEDYTDLSPLTSSSKLQYPISSSHGPDSNTAFTSENSLRILKPNRFDPRIDEDDEVDYSMGGNHLDEFIKQPSASIEAPNGLEKIRRSSDTTPRPLLFPMAVSSITSLTPGDFWPETQDVNLP